MHRRPDRSACLWKSCMLTIRRVAPDRVDMRRGIALPDRRIPRPASIASRSSFSRLLSSPVYRPPSSAGAQSDDHRAGLAWRATRPGRSAPSASRAAIRPAATPSATSRRCSASRSCEPLAVQRDADHRRRPAIASISGPFELLVELFAREHQRRRPAVRTVMRVLGQVPLLDQRCDFFRGSADRRP